MSGELLIAGMTSREWQKLAAALAHDAHEYNFSSHWGTELVASAALDDKIVGFCFFDNHPSADRPERRALEHAELAAFLGARKCRLVASATHGDDGYTIAHVFIVDRAESTKDWFVDGLRLEAAEAHEAIFLRNVAAS